MFVKSRSDWYTAWIGLEQNIINTAVNEWRKCLLEVLQAILLQAVEKWTTE